MSQNFFITGNPKVGKTTLLKDIIRELRRKGLKVGGFVSPEERHHGTRTAFYVMDIETGKQEILASIDGDGPKVSKYHVNIKSFESVAIPAMERTGVGAGEAESGSDRYDVFVIDEIGRMEMMSERFAQLLDLLVESSMPLVAAIHPEYMKTYGASGEMFELTESNREAVSFDILKKVDDAFKKKANVALRSPKPNAAVPKLSAKPRVTLAPKPKTIWPAPRLPANKGKTAKKINKNNRKKTSDVGRRGKDKVMEKEKKKEKAGKKNLIEHLKELFRG